MTTKYIKKIKKIKKDTTNTPRALLNHRKRMLTSADIKYLAQEKWRA